MLLAYGHQFFQADLGGETHDPVIAGMHLKQNPRPVRYGVSIIARMGAVGRADLAQYHAALAHDLRDTERAADLDQLPAGNNPFPPLRQRVQRQ